MIVGSLLLLLAGAALLVTGLVRGDDTYLVGAIVASLIAAVCLYGASKRNKARHPAEPSRRRATARSAVADDDTRLRGRDLGGREALRGRDDRRAREDETVAVTARSREDEPGYANPDDKRGAKATAKDKQSARAAVKETAAEVDGVPGDEPAEVPMSSVEAAALMRMDAEVMVVDGRPRFHLGGCVHLVGRDAEALPAFEAVELGFGACALCRPAQSLLREPTRR